LHRTFWLEANCAIYYTRTAKLLLLLFVLTSGWCWNY
jgi:hypothetical protein